MSPIIVVLFFFVGILFRYKFFKYIKFRDYLNKYLIYFALPLLVFLAISGTDIDSMGRYALISLIIAVLLIVLMFLIVRKTKLSKREKAALFLCSTFGNTAFLGIPLSFMLFGDYGARIAGVFSFVIIFFHFTIGLFIANKFADKKLFVNKIFKAPFFWILLFVFGLAQLNITLPVFFRDLSSFTPSLAVFIIGSGLTLSSFKPKVFTYSFLKLLVAPLVVVPFFFFVGTPDFLVFLFLAAMPSAFLNVSLVLEFGFDEKFALSLTTFTTLFVLLVFVKILLITTI